jgi:hypothetical protein
LAARLPQQVVRSSGRIPKEIPILLIGSDLDGKVFSEPTKTVLLSLHGAGIISQHKLSPEQELVLRWPERNKEAEIRIVGQIGSQAGSHTYGVAFFDPLLNFWGIDFPPPGPAEIEAGLLSLVCSSCKTLEKIDDTGVEADVCATNEGVLRYCKRCGSSTLWKPALRVMNQETVPEAASQMSLFAASPASAPPLAPSPAPPPASSSSLLSAAAPTSAYASSPSQSTTVLTLPPPEKPAQARVNRRKHPRVKVNYSVCVRHPERGEDIVTCEDMSKGGLCFKSSKRYYERSFIEVAVPYVPGQPAIFVPAQIVFVQELPEQRVFRYGVQYLNRTKPRDFF